MKKNKILFYILIILLLILLNTKINKLNNNNNNNISNETAGTAVQETEGTAVQYSKKNASDLVNYIEVADNTSIGAGVIYIDGDPKYINANYNISFDIINIYDNYNNIIAIYLHSININLWGSIDGEYYNILYYNSIDNINLYDYQINLDNINSLEFYFKFTPGQYGGWVELKLNLKYNNYNNIELTAFNNYTYFIQYYNYYGNSYDPDDAYYFNDITINYDLYNQFSNYIYDIYYNDGYEIGYNDGYEIGCNDGYANAGLDGAGFSFEWLSSLFSACNNILNTEIINGFKIWYIIGIPLFFSVIFMILKLFR